MPDSCEPTCTVTTAFGLPVAETGRIDIAVPPERRPVLNTGLFSEPHPRPQPHGDTRRSPGDDNRFCACLVSTFACCGHAKFQSLVAVAQALE